MLHFQKVGAIHRRWYLWDAGQHWLASLQQHGQEPTGPSIQKLWGTCPKSLCIRNIGRPSHRQPLRHGSQGFFPCPSFLAARGPGEPPRGFKEALLTPREGPVNLGLAWNWIRRQETEKQQASGEGSEEGGPTDPSGQTLTAPTLALTDAGISDRFCAGWFSHSIFSL